ncbi:MAG TPA: DUF2934 domain-containing protein [Candidatus Sulfotelmatobacter sp.]|nr:DUF2934 domain-containing protein [Candidatus Sulfotelmatobacter sp.]
MARSKSPSSKSKGASPTNGEAVSATTPNPSPESAEFDAIRPEARKLESRKADARGNVVPINLEDEIRQRAYELAEQRSFQGGDPTQDWLIAEREVLQRYRQQSA